MYPRQPSTCRPRLTVEPLEDRSLPSTSNLSAVTRTESTPPPEQPVAREATSTRIAEAPVKTNTADPGKDRTPASEVTRNTPTKADTTPEVLATNATARPTNVISIVPRRTPPQSTPAPVANSNTAVVVTPPASATRPLRTAPNLVPSAAVAVPARSEATSAVAPRAVQPGAPSSALLSASVSVAVSAPLPGTGDAPAILADLIPAVPIEDVPRVEAISAALSLPPLPEEAAPGEAGLAGLSGELTADLSSLTAALEAFLAGLGEFGQTLAGWQSGSALPYWVLTAALTAAAGEALRRQARRRRAGEELPDSGLPGTWAAEQA